MKNCEICNKKLPRSRGGRKNILAGCEGFMPEGYWVHAARCLRQYVVDMGRSPGFRRGRGDRRETV